MLKRFKSPDIHRTPLYRAKAAYSNMLRRCENKCGTEPAYEKVKLKITLDKWLEWSIPRYIEFDLKYPNLSPSVSRKEDKGHYKIGNIEIVPLEVNRSSMRMPGQAKDGQKRCSTCKKKKNVTHFSKNKSARDGFLHQCKECRKAISKEYNNRPEVKAHRRESRRKK